MGFFGKTKGAEEEVAAGWGPPLEFPVVSDGMTPVFRTRLPRNMQLKPLADVARPGGSRATPAPGKAAAGDGRAALFLAPIAESAFLIGSATPIVTCAITTPLGEDRQPDVFTTLSVALTDVVRPPYCSDDHGDGLTTVTELDTPLIQIDRN
jgi:hypothetical protein